MWYMNLVEANVIPDFVLRPAVRRMVAGSTYERYRVPESAQAADQAALVEKFRRSPIAIRVDDANRQHYEVPAEFFQIVLGKRLKYSACYWPEGVETLDDAEAAMLRLTCERAGLQDGMDVLDLGCGWGSLALWVAEQYPHSRVLAVSNSRTQKAFIEARARAQGLDNLDVQTADMNDFTTDRRFDRVLSVEMFEHMKNYAALLARIKGWLKADGRLFVHIFSHRRFAYEFSADDPSDWMAYTFFAGGTMPSHDLLSHFQDDLTLLAQWHLDGRHYARTLRAWLDKLDANRDAVRRVLRETYGPEHETRWLVNWRLFFIACEEVFALGEGQEYQVSHYLFAPR